MTKRLSRLWRGLPMRDRRTLLAGAAVILVLVLGFRGLPAWRAWSGTVIQASLDVRREAERAAREVHALPAARDSLAAREARLRALGRTLVPGETPATAAGWLASSVAGAAGAAGVRLGTTQLRIDTTGASPFARVGLRLDATGDVAGLTRFLATLEQGPARLAIRQLAVTQPEVGAPHERMESLRIELLVEGLALGAASRRTAAP